MNGKYKAEYLQFIDDAINDKNQIALLIQNYSSRNDFKDPKDWYKGHSLCQLSYQIGTIDKEVEQLFGMLMDKEVLLHSSEGLETVDYEEWFGVTKRLNDIFINLGYTQAYLYQYNLLSTAREGFLDEVAAKEYLTKGVEIEDASCIAMSKTAF